MVDELRELDLAIAEKVFGKSNIDARVDFRSYATDISNAMQVVEKLVDDGWAVVISAEPDSSNRWMVTFNKIENAEILGDDDVSASLPLAICRAALATLPSKPVEQETKS